MCYPVEVLMMDNHSCDIALNYRQSTLTQYFELKVKSISTNQERKQVLQIGTKIEHGWTMNN